MTVRLYLDGSNCLWAHVRCGVCTDVNKYPAIEAAQHPIQCKSCGHSMDVRDPVITVAAQRSDISGETLTTLSGVTRPSGSKGAHR
jgi:hypothetical protein